MLWLILFLSLFVFVMLINKSHITNKHKQVVKKVWPHEFRIIEKRKDDGKPYFIVLRWRGSNENKWGIVGRYIAEDKPTVYFNITTTSKVLLEYTIDKFEWDTKEEAQEIANAYCEYHMNAEYEEVVGEFRIN